jgi:hypothetical protein
MIPDPNHIRGSMRREMAGSKFEFTVASLYVKAAKTAVLMQIAPIVLIEKSITYA